MLPIAKSTEAFYINKTIFDRFSIDTGVTTDMLTSFDGVFAAANAYCDWSGGQNFLQINDYYHYAYVGMKANGGEFIVNGQLMTDTPVFEAIWNPLAEAAILIMILTAFICCVVISRKYVSPILKKLGRYDPAAVMCPISAFPKSTI